MFFSKLDVIRNEKLANPQKIRVGYFSFYKNNWIFVNKTLFSMKDISEDKDIPRGSMVKINNGKKLLLSKK